MSFDLTFDLSRPAPLCYPARSGFGRAVLGPALEPSNPSGEAMSRFWIRLSATFFFTGHFPIAPATFGSFVTLAIWWLLPPMSAGVMVAVLVALTLFSIWAAGRGEEIYGHDGKPIVIDEVVGSLLTVAFLGHSLRLAVIGFFVFRALDVIKPPPAYQLQSLPGGYGVTADDVMAGIYGNILLRLAALVWPGLIGG
jgi:phosphatidylglycerophosphatase A